MLRHSSASSMSFKLNQFISQDVFPWPDQFLKVYIDDAMGERLWADHPECRQFTDNILTAFNTILPPAIRNGEEGAGQNFDKIFRI